MLFFDCSKKIYSDFLSIRFLSFNSFFSDYIFLLEEIVKMVGFLKIEECWFRVRSSTLNVLSIRLHFWFQSVCRISMVAAKHFKNNFWFFQIFGDFFGRPWRRRLLKIGNPITHFNEGNVFWSLFYSLKIITNRLVLSFC